jgi:hypothetical protein
MYDFLLTFTASTLSNMIYGMILLLLISGYFLLYAVIKDRSTIFLRSAALIIISVLGVYWVCGVKVVEKNFMVILGEYKESKDTFFNEFNSSDVSIFSIESCTNQDKKTASESTQRDTSKCATYLATIECNDLSFKDCVSKIRDNFEQIKLKSVNRK